jgi:hypothetical protein
MNILSTIVEWLQTGFGLVMRFIELLQLAATSMDYALTVLHTSQITIGHTRSSQSVTVFTSRCLVAASIGGGSPSSGFPNRTRPQLPATHSNSSQWLNPSGYLTHQPAQLDSLTVLLIISRHVPHRKHSSSVVYGLLPSNGRCLIVSWLLPSNGSTCHNTFLMISVDQCRDAHVDCLTH